MNAPDPPHCTLNSCFSAFRTIWMHLGPLGCLTNLGAKWACKSSCHKVELEFFATNAPDPPQMTLNSCFGAFRTIWVHLGPLSCHTNLEAKCSELVQKFVTRSRVGVYHDERTRSTPLDLKLMFWCVSYHLGPLCFLTKLGAKHSELLQMFVPRSRIGIFSQRTMPIHPTGP